MSASIDQMLLHAALRCGMRPGGRAAYRLQLFLVANRDLGSTNHQSDFQRALETAVDRKAFFENHEYRGSGEYAITEKGFKEALMLFGPVQATYAPASKGLFRATMRGVIGSVHVEVLTCGTGSKVFFNGEAVRSAKEACRRLEISAGVFLPTQGDSAVRVLQDFAIDRAFEIELS